MDKLQDFEEQLNTDWVFNEIPQVLAEIFSNLSLLRDRQNARLVCQNWFKIMREQKQFWPKEKFVCNASFDRHTFIQTIEKSPRNILNLEFSSVDFTPDSGSLEFWQKCGPMIKSLIFENCTFSDQTLKYVIWFCDDLRSLSLTEDTNWPIGEYDEEMNFGGPVCLDELSHVRRESLSTLHLRVRRLNRLPNNFLRALFAIYPNVKEFSFNVSQSDYPDEDDASEQELAEGCTAKDRSLLRSSEKSKLAIFSKIFNDSQAVFESIVMNELMGDVFSEYIWKTISGLSFPRLRRIGINFLLHQSCQPYIDFLSRHNQLQSVHIAVNRDGVGSSKLKWEMRLFLHGILDKCPYLQFLKLSTYLKDPINEDKSRPFVKIRLDKPLFTKLVNSRLVSFEYDTFHFIFAPSELITGDTVNYNLRSLCLSLPYSSENHVLLFSRSFVGLTHLEVGAHHYLEDNYLQCILKFQVNLKCLSLKNCVKLTDFGFTGYYEDTENGNIQSTRYSIQKLQQLEYLCLELLDSNSVTTNTIVEFNFPNLLHLKMHYRRSYSAEEVGNLPAVILLTKLPKLEVLSWKAPLKNVDVYSWLGACGRLKRLRFLDLHTKQFGEFDDEKYKLTFEFCPNLCYLRHSANRFAKCPPFKEYNSYYRDLTNGTVVKSKLKKRVRIFSERFDTFWVEDWMRI